MTPSNDTFPMENSMSCIGEFNTQVFVRGREQELAVKNITAEAPENISYATIEVFGEAGLESRRLPIGDSTFCIPNGAVIMAHSDDENVKVLIGWQ